MNRRRWQDWRQKMRAIREAVAWLWEVGGESGEEREPDVKQDARIEADRQKQVARDEADREKQIARIEADRQKQISRIEADRQSKSAQALIRDIREAHRDWINAYRHFEYAAGFDQIDYAIYAIEAAEKRYEMLLRQAKKLNVHWRSEWEKGAGAG